MRLGIRTAISALVLTSIIVSAVGVHLLWWRTAHQVSQTLANTINDQIVSAVGDELQSVTSEARLVDAGGAHAARRESVRPARRRENVRSCSGRNCCRSRPSPGWRSGGRTDRSLPGTSSATMSSKCSRISPDRNLRINRYEFVGNDLKLKASWFEETDYSVTEQEWFRVAHETNDEYWSTLTVHPRGDRLAAAFSAPVDIDKKPAGVVACLRSASPAHCRRPHKRLFPAPRRHAAVSDRPRTLAISSTDIPKPLAGTHPLPSTAPGSLETHSLARRALLQLRARLAVTATLVALAFAGLTSVAMAAEADMKADPSPSSSSPPPLPHRRAGRHRQSLHRQNRHRSESLLRRQLRAGAPDRAGPKPKSSSAPTRTGWSTSRNATSFSSGRATTS